MNESQSETPAWLSALVEHQRELSHSLHDQVLPVLAALRLSHQAVLRTGNAQALLGSLGEALDELDAWARNRRRHTYALLVQRAGLVEALIWAAADLQCAVGAPIVVANRVGAGVLPLGPSVALFALCQELLVRWVRGAQNGATIRVASTSASVSIELHVSSPDALEPARPQRQDLLERLGGSVQLVRDDHELVVHAVCPRVC